MDNRHKIFSPSALQFFHYFIPTSADIVAIKKYKVYNEITKEFDTYLDVEYKIKEEDSDD